MRQHTSHLSKQSSDAGPWPRRTTEAANISRAGCTKQWTTQSSVQCCALHSGTCSQQSDKPATHTKRHNAKPCMCASDKTVHRTVMIVHHERPPQRGHRQYTGSGRLGVPTWVEPLLCAPSMPPTSHIHTTNAPHSSQMCHSQSVSQPDAARARHNPRHSSTQGGGVVTRPLFQNTHQATRHTTPHVLQHIYAEEEADGTRQGSSPPRRALCVSCSGCKPTTTRIWGQVSAQLGCARLGLCRCSKAEHPRRPHAATSPRPSRTRPGFGWQNVALKSGQKNPPNQTS
jgi:hypothetical protein